MTPQTKIEDLTGPHMWRLKKAVANYNKAVDKDKELHTVEDIFKNDIRVFDLQGVGHVTSKRFYDLVYTMHCEDLKALELIF